MTDAQWREFWGWLLQKVHDQREDLLAEAKELWPDAYKELHEKQQRE